MQEAGDNLARWPHWLGWRAAAATQAQSPSPQSRHADQRHRPTDAKACHRANLSTCDADEAQAAVLPLAGEGRDRREATVLRRNTRGRSSVLRVSREDLSRPEQAGVDAR